MSNLAKLFSPKSIAIIGATVRQGAIGNTVVRNFRISNYPGAVYPINSRYDIVEGFTCYPTITAIKDEIDLAILAIPSELIEEAITDCQKQGVKHLLIFSSGFAEIGEAGEQLQNRIVAFCKEHNMRILGPNTLGMINASEDLALMFQDVGYTVYKKGEVGLVAQSGATGSQVLSMSSEEEVGFSFMVATGNQPDIDTIEVLDYFIQDEGTKVGAFYMESVPSGKCFLDMAKRALAAKKPIVGIKAGKSEAGKKAAMSHTASLTGSSEIFEVAAKKYGVTLVDGFDPLIDALKAFQASKYPKGNRAASVVVSGAAGILLADLYEEKGLEMAELTAQTKERLREVVASYCSVENPVDIASTFILNEQVFPHSVKTLVEAPEVDIIFIHLPVPTALNPIKFVDMFIEIAKSTDKPIIAIPTGMESEMGVVRHKLTANGIPSYRNLESAVAAAKMLYDYQLHLEKQDSQIETEISSNILLKAAGPNLTEREVKQLMSDAGVLVPNGFLLTSADQAEELQLNYPVVAKISSSEIPHKSDVGGIVLKIENASKLEDAYNQIVGNIQVNCSGVSYEGVYVEEMVTQPFVEFFVGIQNDELFGPVITCGLGGIFVEVIKDVSRKIAPVSLIEAHQIINNLKGAALLKGARTGIQYDVDALAQTIVDLSNLAASFEGDWIDFEVNPLIVLEQGKGVYALDGVISMKNKHLQHS
jgi:acetate---CoA ligase (ADP-forming)